MRYNKNMKKNKYSLHYKVTISKSDIVKNKIRIFICGLLINLAEKIGKVTYNVEIEG